jgi:hypothetical protein
VRISANGQLAFAHYAVDRVDASLSPHSISLLDIDGDRIVAITAFLMPQLFPMFGLGGEPIFPPAS